jgi:dynein heavy chain 2, cytosolic
MTAFVYEAFNNEQIQPASFELKNLYENESSSTDPILFITSPGSDPSAELQQFAE